MLIWESGGFRILGIVYTVLTLVLELDFLFIFFVKKFSHLKNVFSISSGLFPKFEKNFLIFKFKKA